MNEIEKEMMLGMISLLNDASEAYYNTGHPIMTDKQFDARLADLRQLEEETGFVFSNSPTINVGAKVLTELNEVTHNHPMLSLEKCHTPEEIIKFANNHDLVASVKLDGLTVSLTYEDGILIKGETRGNGAVGSDITEHIKQFKNVPMKINKTGTYVIDGEAIITDEDFAEINVNGEYKNSRNLASGTLSVLDTSLVSKRRLKFFAWDIIEGGGDSLQNNLCEAKDLHFDVVPFWFNSNSANALNPKNLQGNIDYVFEYAKDIGLPCDGIVFKFNDIEYGKSLGSTSHHFKNGIAYKAKDDVYETKLIDIEFTMGKTGVLTPTAIFEPVEIDGAMVSRASLHNISIMRDLCLCVGDTIEVYKANMIIPQVKRNVSAEQRKYVEALEAPTIDAIEYCPICHSETELVTENNSTILICKNDNCKGKLLGKLTHFVSKKAMDIDSLSEKTLEFLINQGWVKCFKDIYHLSEHRSEWKHMDGFGEASVKKILDAIETSRNTTLDRFICALSIPMIGSTASKAIAKNCFGDYDTLVQYIEKRFDWTLIDGFGNTMKQNLDDYFDNHFKEMDLLACEMNFQSNIEDYAIKQSVFTDKNICVTGKLNNFTRDSINEKIVSLGAKVSSGVTAKTDYLITNTPDSGSSKNINAKKFGTKIITESEFLNMIRGG